MIKPEEILVGEIFVDGETITTHIHTLSEACKINGQILKRGGNPKYVPVATGTTHGEVSRKLDGLVKAMEKWDKLTKKEEPAED